MVGDGGLETSDLLWLKQTSLNTIKRSPHRLTGNPIQSGKLAQALGLVLLRDFRPKMLRNLEFAICRNL
jgi:hypothetical protein